MPAFAGTDSTASPAGTTVVSGGEPATIDTGSTGSTGSTASVGGNTGVIAAGGADVLIDGDNGSAQGSGTGSVYIPANGASAEPTATDAPSTTDATGTTEPATTDATGTTEPATTDATGTTEPATTDAGNQSGSDGNSGGFNWLVLLIIALIILIAIILIVVMRKGKRSDS